MRVTRICHPGPFPKGAVLALDERASLHLTRVLRMQVGSPLRLFDGVGSEHHAEVSAVRGKRVEVTIGAVAEPAAESPLAITLAQGVSRGERMDYALQKATELGVARIVPVICERSVVRLDERQAAVRHEHWRGVVTSAAEQCGRAVLPAIAPPVGFAQYLAALAPATGPTRILFAPDATEGLRSLPAEPGGVELLVGPEGGLSETEQRLAAGRGFRSLRLGPRILRTETAAAAAIAALQVLHGDLG